MTGEQIVRAAIPNASAELCDHILWGRTPFPCGQITARSLYKAASSYHRANVNGITLCDFCERPANAKSFTCDRCHEALSVPVAA